MMLTAAIACCGAYNNFGGSLTRSLRELSVNVLLLRAFVAKLVGEGKRSAFPSSACSRREIAPSGLTVTTRSIS
jgi:hypothetical protein